MSLKIFMTFIVVVDRVTKDAFLFGAPRTNKKSGKKKYPTTFRSTIFLG